MQISCTLFQSSEGIIKAVDEWLLDASSWNELMVEPFPFLACARMPA